MKLSSKNLLVGLLVGFSAGVVVTGVAVSYMYTSTYTKAGVTAQKFRADTAFVLRAADEINRHLPIMIDENTRLDSTSGAGDHFAFIYSLINVSKEEIVESEIEAYALRYGANSICSSETFTKLREHGINISLIYRDMNGVSITTVEIDDAVCNGI